LQIVLYSSFAHLFAKLYRLGDSIVTFLVFQVKLPSVTTSLTTQTVKDKGKLIKCLAQLPNYQGHQANLPAQSLSSYYPFFCFNAERQAGKL